MKNLTFYSINNANSDSIVVSSGTDTVANLYDSDTSTSWQANASTSSITYDSSVYSPTDGRATATTITLLGINWKSFSISNGVTTSANVLSGDTSSANFVSNSATNIFLELDSANFTSSWTITVSSTFDNENPKCAELSIFSQLCEVDINPSYDRYNPIMKRISVEHKMQDDGLIIYNFGIKYASEITLTNISEETRNELLEVFEYNGKFNFIPYPGESWNGQQYSCFWVNNFQFYNPTDDIYEMGYSGKISLEGAA